MGLVLSILVGSSLYTVHWYRKFRQLSSHYIEHRYDAKTKKVSYTLTPTPPHYWTFLAELSQKSYGAILISEDWGFYQHYGIDLAQMWQAILDFLRGEKLRGASTITQQLIKNIYLTPQKSWQRKAHEAILALIMERALSKEKILENYLNIIEYGEGLYGIARACELYFKKYPQSITVREGAFLAMLLPSPKKYSASFKNRTLSPFASQSIDETLQKMKLANYLSAQELLQAQGDTFSWETPSWIEEDSPNQ